MSLLNAEVVLNTRGRGTTGFTFAVLGPLTTNGADYLRREQGENPRFTADYNGNPFVELVEYKFTVYHPVYAPDEVLLRYTFDANGNLVPSSPAENPGNLGTNLPDVDKSLLIELLLGISYYAGPQTTLILTSGSSFDYDPDSTEEIDGVYVLDAPGKGSGRWLRRYGLYVSVQDYGAVPDANFETGAGTDNTVAIQKCINFCDRHNLIVWFPGIGGYRITSGLLLKRNIRGIEMSNSSPIMPTGSGYWAIVTETSFSWQVCKIKVVGPSVVQGGVVQRVLINGVQLNNPLRSNIESVEAFHLSGTGIDIVDPYDSNFFTMTAEDCGNLFYYAYVMRGEGGDTANMSNVHRLQVEKAHDRAIYIQGDTLCVSHHNIHSEQAMVTVNLQSQTDPYTWVIGGGNCDYYGAPRFNATTDPTKGFSPEYAKIAVRGAYVNIYNPRIESAINIDLDANGNGPIDIYGGSLSGKTQSLGTGGRVTIHSAKVAYGYGVTDKMFYENCDIDVLDVGFTPRLDAQLTVSRCRIQTLKSTYVHARAHFENSTQIASGTLPQGYTRLTNSTFRGNLLVGYTKLELFNSEIIGNVFTDTGYLGMYNTSRITGSLSVGTHPMVIIDQTSTVTGTVTGMAPPDIDLYYPGGWVEGMITRNPKTFQTWQYYQGSWVLVGISLAPLYKAGDPALSDCSLEQTRIITNTLTGKRELVYNGGGTLYCIEMTACVGTPPAVAIPSITGHYELVELENNAPEVNAPTSFITATQGAAFDYPFPDEATFTDADNDPLTYTMQYSTDGGTSWGALPAWAAYSGGHFTGTPPVTSSSGVNYLFRVTADDGRGGTVSDPFNLICLPED